MDGYSFDFLILFLFFIFFQMCKHVMRAVMMKLLDLSLSLSLSRAWVDR